MLRIFARTSLLLLTLIGSAQAADPRTFCNPIDVDYGIRDVGKHPARHGADPCIVLYKNRYWLFSTWDRPGYRVSDDLIHWSYVPFDPASDLAKETYTAAAAVEIDGWLYYTEFGRAKRPVSLWRTKEPEKGVWEKIADLPPYADPCLFVDPPTGRVFMYAGLDQPIRGVELDRKTFAEIPGTKTPLREPFDPTKPIPDGWEVCTWDNNPQSKGMRSNKGDSPCREGAWMTYFKGKYYLQYASPGTTVPGYSDGVLVGDAPLGPFKYAPYSPISRKDSGFITSAGHSCLFQDRYGNWWRAVTMLIGVNERMERRVGLFPAGFDADGVPFTRTDLGDLPIIVPDAQRPDSAEIHPRWAILSEGKPIKASSELQDHPAHFAADEDIRTWWSAKTGETGEWLEMDLARPRAIRAIQLNLADQDYWKDDGAKDEQKFIVEVSTDENHWTPAIDRSQQTTSSPNAYTQFDRAMTARYLRVKNLYTPRNGKFAISDLRVFGDPEGAPPPAVTDLKVDRDPADRRKVKLTWTPAAGASKYLIRYGTEREKLYQHHLVPSRQTELQLYCLNGEPAYFFRIDAVSEGGLTPGPAIIAAP